MRLECHTGFPFLDNRQLEPISCLKDGRITDLPGLLPNRLGKTGELYHFGLSGGKDSQAALLWALHVAKLPPERIVVSACDTGNEHDVTYRQIELIDETVHPVIMIKPGLDFWGLVDRKGMFPTRKKRFCTQYLKMQPTQRFCHALEALGYTVIMYSGVRAAESDDRAKLPAEEWDMFFGMQVRRPILTWTLQDVLDIHRQHGLPLNPLYGWGARRVGCFPCINSVKAEMRIVPEVAPDKVQKIDDKEQELTKKTGEAKTFFHRKTVPLRFRTVKFTAKDGRHLLVCSINDVVKWAKWLNKKELKALAAKQQKEMPFTEDQFQSCSAGMGQCE